MGLVYFMTVIKNQDILRNHLEEQESKQAKQNDEDTSMTRLQANLQAYYGGKLSLPTDYSCLVDLQQQSQFQQKGQLVKCKYKTEGSGAYTGRRREFKERKIRNQIIINQQQKKKQKL